MLQGKWKALLLKVVSVFHFVSLTWHEGNAAEQARVTTGPYYVVSPVTLSHHAAFLLLKPSLDILSF